VIKSISQIISEIALIVLYPFSAIVLRSLPQKAFAPSGEGQVIVIVERWVNYNIRHFYWKYYLQKQGFRVYLKNFPIYKGDFDKSSRNLSKFLTSNNLKNVILVGISSGAITSLIYLQERNGWERISKFVAIGAPFKGTWSSIFLIFSRSGWELFPHSSLIKRISEYRINNVNKILCIGSKFDEMVPSGVYLPEAHTATINVIGHNNLHIMVRTTYRKIVDFASKEE